MLTRRRNSRLSVLDVISSALFRTTRIIQQTLVPFIYIYIHVSSFLLIVCETRGKLIHRSIDNHTYASVGIEGTLTRVKSATRFQSWPRFLSSLL